MAEAYATQADLEIALGGPAELVKLSDFDQNGVADSAVVDDYLEVGSARVRAAVEVKHEPEAIAALSAASRKLLAEWNVALSARAAWEKGSKGQAVPDRIVERAERALADLDRVAAGTLRLGRVAGGAGAAINQVATGAVDPDPNGQGMTLTAFRSSGFR